MPIDRIDIALGDDGPEDSDMENLLPGNEPVQPGQPAAENVFFVLLGIALALGVVTRLLMLYG